MNYIVLDLEWNQTYFAKNMIQHPVLLRGEIVQIGAVKLDGDFAVVDTFQAMIAPKYYKRMHRRVAKLTGITNERLRQGLSFPEVFEHFQDWCGGDFAFLTWGPDDIGMLRDNMLLHGLDIGWLPDTYNVQLIYDDQVAHEGRQVSLTDAMEKLGQPPFQAHDALNDAHSTACVCSCLDMEKGLVGYEAMMGEKRGHSKHKARPVVTDEDGAVMLQSDLCGPYPSRKTALADEELTDFYCSGCQSRVVCRQPVPQDRNRYICIGNCPDGQELFVRFKFKKQEDGTFMVARILWELNGQNRQRYQQVKRSGGRPYYPRKNRRRA